MAIRSVAKRWKRRERRRPLGRAFPVEQEGMKTLLISGSDTDVGKTWVTASLARLLASRGARVQVVKPVETGVGPGESGDVERVLGGCESELVEGFTIRRYREAVAPLAAAEREGLAFCIDDLVTEVARLPECDWRLVEGAGSIAVPLDGEGRDWADFGKEILADRVLLVVTDRLGGIGQARMAFSYAESKGLRAGIWMNEVSPQDESTRRATLVGIEKCGLPLWATQRFGQREPQLRALGKMELGVEG